MKNETKEKILSSVAVLGTLLLIQITWMIIVILVYVISNYGGR